MNAVDLRASDDDRERVAAVLREHTAAGRLTLDELSDRMAAAYAARTLGELASLTVDLPSLAESGRRHGAALSLTASAIAALIAVIFVVGVLVAVAGPAMAGGGMAAMCH